MKLDKCKSTIKQTKSDCTAKRSILQAKFPETLKKNNVITELCCSDLRGWVAASKSSSNESKQGQTLDFEKLPVYWWIPDWDLCQCVRQQTGETLILQCVKPTVKHGVIQICTTPWPRRVPPHFTCCELCFASDIWPVAKKINTSEANCLWIKQNTYL